MSLVPHSNCLNYSASRPDICTVFQAQTVRLCYAALIDTPGAVIVSDMDLIPLESRYYTKPWFDLDSKQFLVYRDLLTKLNQYPICFNAAHPTVWGSVLKISNEDDVANRLKEFHRICGGGTFSGLRGGHGWFCDQEMLYQNIEQWEGTSIKLGDSATKFKQMH